MRSVAPRPVTSFTPAPRELDRNLWLLDRQLRFPGGACLPSRTTLVRLESGALLVLSPPPLPTDALDAIGVVEHVVVPNSFHYVYAADFMLRYPAARLFVAPGLPERVPELPAAEVLSPTPPAAWSRDLDLSILGPVRGLSEVVFFHRATGSLILTDLAFHLPRFPRSVDRIAWRAAGIPSAFGPARTSRRFLLRDHAAASRCLRRAAQWPFRRIIPAHGDVIEDDAKAQFLRAFERYVAPS